ncbi:MAG: type IV pili methyl-accepting chemotaxis transducer N-terminal domain-containing protein [Rhodocyclaceae bacterium]|nr:type IV pili methyl-accepting chemotaxis transducer N-terminal domain-containing protein [Rhodocyclaceae bacterium]
MVSVVLTNDSHVMSNTRSRRAFIASLGSLGLALAVSPAWAQTAPAAPESISLAAAINKAGRQRMLSQRCAKCWLMISEGVLADRAGKWLEQSIALFEDGMTSLSTLQPSPEIRESLAQLEAAWRPYLATLLQSPSKAKAKAVFDASDEVLAIAHQTTKAYEAQASSAVGNLINIAGRQRMLSQRMAKFYFFERIGVEADASRLALEKAAHEFVDAMKVLRESSETTEAIAAELALADQQWFFFDAAIREPVGERAARNIATTSERILQQLDLVVSRYEALAG